MVEPPDKFLKELFQQEFAKMVAVISGLFGLEHIEMAEDIVGDTFLTAAEEWGKKGLPENPTAWLYTVAKRKTIHLFRRQKILHQKVLPALTAGQSGETASIDLDFSPKHIRDSQLQMLFAICTPAIASEAQIGLALRILCGFGIDEIAEAFLSNKETINKRLFRAKEKLRTEKVNLELPPQSDIPARLDNVLHIIYLLFSEGYYSKTQNHTLQKELCFEAMRLGVLLTEYELTNQPKTNALMALMCFHASRFDARQTGEAAYILYDQQDERLWDATLIHRGMQYLTLSAKGDRLSSYHLEARIASWHCIKEDSKNKWEEILQLYNQLLMINYSPAVALNRTFALYKANGREEALVEAEKLQLENDHFYFLLLGYLYKDIDNKKAKLHWEKAYALARTAPERREILDKLKTLPPH
jgi:RNA polymerase sigma-70 factor (ECF subfamily)